VEWPCPQLKVDTREWLNASRARICISGADALLELGTIDVSAPTAAAHGPAGAGDTAASLRHQVVERFLAALIQAIKDANRRDAQRRRAGESMTPVIETVGGGAPAANKRPVAGGVAPDTKAQKQAAAAAGAAAATGKNKKRPAAHAMSPVLLALKVGLGSGSAASKRAARDPAQGGGVANGAAGMFPGAARAAAQPSRRPPQKDALTAAQLRKAAQVEALRAPPAAADPVRQPAAAPVRAPAAAPIAISHAPPPAMAKAPSVAAADGGNACEAVTERAAVVGATAAGSGAVGASVQKGGDGQGGNVKGGKRGREVAPEQSRLSPPAARPRSLAVPHTAEPSSAPPPPSALCSAPAPPSGPSPIFAAGASPLPRMAPTQETQPPGSPEAALRPRSPPKLRSGGDCGAAYRGAYRGAADRGTAGREADLGADRAPTHAAAAEATLGGDSSDVESLRLSPPSAQPPAVLFPLSLISADRSHSDMDRGRTSLDRPPSDCGAGQCTPHSPSSLRASPGSSRIGSPDSLFGEHHTPNPSPNAYRRRFGLLPTAGEASQGGAGVGESFGESFGASGGGSGGRGQGCFGRRGPLRPTRLDDSSPPPQLCLGPMTRSSSTGNGARNSRSGSGNWQGNHFQGGWQNGRQSGRLLKRGLATVAAGCGRGLPNLGSRYAIITTNSSRLYACKGYQYIAQSALSALVC